MLTVHSCLAARAIHPRGAPHVSCTGPSVWQADHCRKSGRCGCLVQPVARPCIVKKLLTLVGGTMSQAEEPVLALSWAKMNSGKGVVAGLGFVI